MIKNFLVLIFCVSLSNTSLAQGGAGGKITCENELYRFEREYAPNGASGDNPFERFKNKLRLESKRYFGGEFAEKYEFIQDIDNSAADLGELLAVEAEVCTDSPTHRSRVGSRRIVSTRCSRTGAEGGTQFFNLVNIIGTYENIIFIEQEHCH